MTRGKSSGEVMGGGLSPPSATKPIEPPKKYSPWMYYVGGASEGYSIKRLGKSDIEMANSDFMELSNRSMILPFQTSVDCTKSMDSSKVQNLLYVKSHHKVIARRHHFQTGGRL
jgi:hypothetical protein